VLVQAITGRGRPRVRAVDPSLDGSAGRVRARKETLMKTKSLIQNGCDKDRHTPITQNKNTMIEPKPQKAKFVSRQKTKRCNF
jgi:hypothetical protein